MGKRRKAREIVLQALYEAEFSDKPREEVFSDQINRREPGDEITEHAHRLFVAVMENISDLDGRIESSLENWDMERIAIVDKNILRFALTEILYFEDVPSRVIINEAIEVAHRYSTAEAGRFINGLLDRFVRDIRKGSV